MVFPTKGRLEITIQFFHMRALSCIQKTSNMFGSRFVTRGTLTHLTLLKWQGRVLVVTAVGITNLLTEVHPHVSAAAFYARPDLSRMLVAVALKKVAFGNKHPQFVI